MDSHGYAVGSRIDHFPLRTPYNSTYCVSRSKAQYGALICEDGRDPTGHASFPTATIILGAL